MQKYLDLCKEVLETGTEKTNRTGVNTVGIHGGMAKFDLREGFPAVTTKRLAFKSVVAELLGFMRGTKSAAEFRELGTPIWDANANDNATWLANRHREGTDDLGRIYGAQWRDWPGYVAMEDGIPAAEREENIDQLKIVVDKLLNGNDDRRLIVTAWNPAELNKAALPPCHCLYQFGLDGDTLNMGMYQRSCDMPLGVPFNIASYSLLLAIVARITGYKAGVFTHFLWDMHIYANQIDLMKGQLARRPLTLPNLHIHQRLRTLDDFCIEATTEDFTLLDYSYHPAINYPMAV